MHPKTTENRCRRVAARRGVTITKTRRRDPEAIDYHGYMILDLRGKPVAGNVPYPYSFTLENVVDWLERNGGTARKPTP